MHRKPTPARPVIVRQYTLSIIHIGTEGQHKRFEVLMHKVTTSIMPKVAQLTLYTDDIHRGRKTLVTKS